MPKNVKIIIPDNAAELILLSQNILAKHLADGAVSYNHHLENSECPSEPSDACSENSEYPPERSDPYSENSECPLEPLAPSLFSELCEDNILLSLHSL